MARNTGNSGRGGNPESNILVTSAQAAFATQEDEDIQVKLILEEHRGKCTKAPLPNTGYGGTGWTPYSAGWRCYRLYPAVNAILAASRGEVSYAYDIGDQQETHQELITFSNSDRASTKYPPVGFALSGSGGGLVNPNNDGQPDENSPIAVDLQFAFDENGQQIAGGGGGGLVAPGSSGGESNLTFSFDPTTFEIVASIPFTGAIRVTYATSFRVIKYLPDFVVTPNVYPSFTYAQHTAYFGNILAFYNGSIAQIEVQAPTLVGPLQRSRELYKITTNVHVNRDGAWEEPDGWDGATWPDAEAPQSAQDKLYIYERHHETGYLVAGSVGIVNRNTNLIRAERPLTGYITSATSGIEPWSLQVNASDQFANTIWEDAYDSIDFDELEQDLQSRYPGVSFS